jgi:hypothetical protein
MSEELYTSWEDFRVGFARILALATRELCIFDDDLTLAGLRQADNMETLRAFLVNNHPQAAARIVLRDTSRLTKEHPRLIDLMKTHGHLLQIGRISDNLQHLRDCIALADGCHALVRFDLEQPRCKLILDDTLLAAPYAQRFAEIWEEPGTPFLPQLPLL